MTVDAGTRGAEAKKKRADELARAERAVAKTDEAVREAKRLLDELRSGPM